MKKLGTPKEFILMTFASFIVTASVFFFLIPSNIPVGSVSGLAIIVNTLVPISVSAWSFIMNAGLLIIGFIFIGREFGAKTVYTSLLGPVILSALEKLFPNNTSLMGDPILDVVCFLFLVSIGLAILFRLNASSGGLDILAKILNKYLHIELGKAMSFAGICAALTSVFVYDVRTVILSVLGTYLSGVVLDHFIFSFGGKKKVCIITSHEDVIKNYILEVINRGATVYEAIGGYDGSVRHEINTIVDESEYKKLYNFILKTDPNAFVTVYSVSEVLDNAKRIPKNV